MITEEIALVTAISGVCRAGVTRPHHVIADEDRQDEDRQPEDEGVDADGMGRAAETTAPAASAACIASNGGQSAEAACGGLRRSRQV